MNYFKYDLDDRTLILIEILSTYFEANLRSEYLFKIN